MTDFTLYHAALKADQEWSRELTRDYGRNAGDARYYPNGRATPELERLYQAKLAADKAWWVECTTGEART